MSSGRKLQYALAINEAFHQMMAADRSVFLMGQGTKSPWYVGKTVQGLLDRFGKARVIDTPVSENAMTGAAVGAALAGMKPIVVHPRMDFMLYAFDPIINQAANWHYMNGGKLAVPVVIWGIINRGGEQAAQHSQALHAMFAHVPGLKVVMPATPYDAKGLMIAAIRDPNPVVYIDDRFLYKDKDIVPEDIYEVEIGKGMVKKKGVDVTVVAVSLMVREAMKAADNLAKQRIDVEVIDLRTVKPIDKDLILASVRKTGRLVVADVGWQSFGISAEIAAIVSEEAFQYLKAPVQRVALPDCPAPASSVLEKEYYKTHKDVEQAVMRSLKGKTSGGVRTASENSEFHGFGGYVKNNRFLKLMYITNNPDIARIAERNTVDRIWIDLETIGKEARQANFNSVKSQHTMQDISVIRDVISSASLLVRINPLHEGTKGEVEEVIARGADIIMLPMYRTAQDAKKFVDMVNGRAKTMLLLETIDAEKNIEETVAISGADEIHIGLNDLHIEYKMKFMFELLANGTVDVICNKITSGGIPYGFGGIAGLDEGGLLPANYIITHHYTIGSSMAILSRSFCDVNIEKDINNIELKFFEGTKKIREFEKFLWVAPPSFFKNNFIDLKERVRIINKDILTAKAIANEYKT